MCSSIYRAFGFEFCVLIFVSQNTFSVRKHITIPSTITEVTGNPFKLCDSLKVINVEGDGLNSEVSKKIEEYLEENFGKGKVKFKSDALLSTAKAGANAAAKTVGGLGSMIGTAVSSLKENENIKNTINETKDVFKKHLVDYLVKSKDYL